MRESAATYEFRIDHPDDPPDASDRCPRKAAGENKKADPQVGFFIRTESQAAAAIDLIAPDRRLLWRAALFL
jgi:hypothetical protein